MHKVAYVEYLKKTDPNRVDPLTKCPRLTWERRSRRFKIIELANIMKIVNVVPSFVGEDKESGEYFLNVFSFK